MKALEEKIMQEGKIYPDNVLKVGAFLNHQIDVMFMDRIGEEFHRLFQEEKITKVLTIETSGIPIACFVALKFGVPVLFAKKNPTKNISNDCYCTEIHSYTHGNTYQARIEKQFLNSEDNVLIIDDFLANGYALIGLIDLVGQAGAKCCGCGIVIEKAFQSGGSELRKMGYRVESLARIESMDPETGIKFVQE